MEEGRCSFLPPTSYAGSSFSLERVQNEKTCGVSISLQAIHSHQRRPKKAYDAAYVELENTIINNLALWPFQLNQKHKTNSGYKHNDKAHFIFDSTFRMLMFLKILMKTKKKYLAIN